MQPVSSQTGTATPDWVLTFWRTPWIWLLIVVTLFCAPLFRGLGGMDNENDESIYSYSVETMVKDRDWLTPKSAPSETSAFLEKPPLKFWLVAGPIAAGWLPANEFGERFVDALFGSLAFLYVFGIGRKLGGPVAGLASVMLLFVHSELLFAHGLRTNNMEASVLLAYCGGVYHFLAWRSVNPDVKRHIYGMALFFVLGFMTKFVAALFLPVVLVLAAAASRQDRVRVYRDWPVFVLAASLATALIVPWFVYQYQREGDAFIKVIFGEHVMKRLTAYLDPTHLHPWHYYLTEIWRSLGANGIQTLTVVGALMLAWRTFAGRSTETLVVLLWFCVPIGVISTTTSKLYHYAYPFLPPVALAGGIVVAGLAALLYRVLMQPVAAFDRARRGIIGPLLDTSAWQVTATLSAFGALLVAAMTYAYDRVWIAAGPVTVRNSSLLKPAVAGVALLITGAPAACVRAALVSALLLIVIPVQAYHRNVAQTKEHSSPYRNVRDCLRPIVDEVVASGKPAPGVWVEPGPLSHNPFFYLRGLGPWQRRDHASNQTVVMHLVVPQYYRPVMLTPDRYDDVFRWMANDRAAALGRASILTGVDIPTLETSMDTTILGLARLENAMLVMPGPYSSCGTERIKLPSR